MISKAESAYIQSGLLQSPPQRLDGRSLTDYRPISLETGVAPLANGSAKLNIGRNPHDGSGGTEVVAATKLEVETIEEGGKDGGRFAVTVTWSVRSSFLKPLRLTPIQALRQHTRISPRMLWRTYNMT